MATSIRQDEYRNRFQPGEKRCEDVEDGEGTSHGEAGGTEAAAEVGDGGSENNHKDAAAAKDGLGRQAEKDPIKDQLEKEAVEIFNEMKECMIFHDIP